MANEKRIGALWYPKTQSEKAPFAKGSIKLNKEATMYEVEVHMIEQGKPACYTYMLEGPYEQVRKYCPTKGCPDCLENYLSGDVMSRLTDNGVLLQFNWADWRKKKRQKEAQK